MGITHVLSASAKERQSWNEFEIPVLSGRKVEESHWNIPLINDLTQRMPTIQRQKYGHEGQFVFEAI